MPPLMLQILSRKVRLPGWTNFGPVGAVGRCISIAAVGNLLLFGDYDGNLIKWDVDAGNSESIFTDGGPVRRIFVNRYLQNGACLVRVAVLSATWKCSIYDLDGRKKFVKTPFESRSRFMDLAWVPGADPTHISTLLAAVTEEGNIIITEVDPPSVISKRGQDLMEADLAPPPKVKNSDILEETYDALISNSSVNTTLVLPKSLTQFIRLILQVGLSLSVLEGMLEPLGDEMDLASFESQIWEKLPIDLRNGDGGLVRSPQTMTSFSSGHSNGGSEASTSDRTIDDRTFLDSRRRNRRKSILMDTSGGMSLASEVLKSIEAQNARSKGFLNRVKVTIKRQEKLRDPMSPVPSSYLAQTLDSNETSRSSGSGGSLCELLRLLAILRCDGKLLLPKEWTAYKYACESNSVIPRMAVAALVSGDANEVAFWMNLASSLQTVHGKMHPNATTSHTPKHPHSCFTSSPLWDQSSTIAAAQCRAKLHDTIPRMHIESHPELQEKRLLEYVSLGDYNTAVGFLLSSAPEASVRYYRDSLCALALASVGAAISGSTAVSPRSTSAPTTPIQSSMGTPNRNSLHLQVAKVVSAHAASVGDSLLGVPLLCAAGLYHEAVSLLQDANLWSYGTVLTAAQLEAPHHAIACLRLAQHVLRDEGDIWRAAGILTTGGCLREAAQVLVDAGYIDCAAAYCEACEEYDLVLYEDEHQEKLSEGRLFSALPSAQLVRITTSKPLRSNPSSSSQDQDLEKYSVPNVHLIFREYVTSLLIGL